MVGFYSLLPILSYCCVFMFIIGARNLGKTTAAKVRAIKRFNKKGYKTVWVRRFKKEADKAARKWITPKSNKLLCELAGISTKDIFCKGRVVYLRRKGKKDFEPFLEIVSVSEFSVNRSADDPRVRDIVYDEFTTTPEKYRHYRGNEVRDFIDLVVSVKRIHPVRVFFLGNKESELNPYFKYFGIPQPERSFAGIRTYKNGSIAVEVRDDLPDAVQTAYDDKFTAALSGTEYLDYLTDGKYKTESVKTVKTPKKARFYAAFNFGNPITIFYYAGCFYASYGIDKTRLVYTNGKANCYGVKYRKEIVFQTYDRSTFAGLICGIKLEKLYYTSVAAFEAFLPIKKALGFTA